MDLVLHIVTEVILYGLGAVIIYVLSFGSVRAAPVKGEFLNELPGRGRLFYTHEGRAYISSDAAQVLAMFFLAGLALLVWWF